MVATQLDNFSSLTVNKIKYRYIDLKAYCKRSGQSLERLPFALRILLEGCLRNNGKQGFSEENAEAIMNWKPNEDSPREAVPFLPARVLMQDFTGLPVLNDLTALRAAIQRDGKNPRIVNPKIPSNLVIDHSVQVQAHACPEAQKINEALEFRQNFERYQFLKWSQDAYDNLRVLPPGLGICHQVNLEHLGQVAFCEEQENGDALLYPDSVLGTDSHTPMINGLGILGWGVGGIEALAAMLSYPTEFPVPDVIGVRFKGTLPVSATATDLTLSLTAMLRKTGVVGSFIEVFGDSVFDLPVETRAMISNMTPESGATTTYFPVDDQTIDYLLRTGRTVEHANLVRYYSKTAGLFQEGNEDITYSKVIEFDLSKVEPVIAGPKRPQDLISLSSVPSTFQSSLRIEKGLYGFGLDGEEIKNSVEIVLNGKTHTISHGSVLIAAITSCTNTSDPIVMITAALMAKKARTAGLQSKPWVKTSFAPGSRVVREYLSSAGLLEALNELGFQIVGYGCTTCIGNSGPIDPALSDAVRSENIIAVGVLSGNRNFEGRIHPDTRANYLMSPPLVLAYALAGTVDFDFKEMPLGRTPEGRDIYLKDILPTPEEVMNIIRETISANVYEMNYENIYTSNEKWNQMEVPQGTIFNWREISTLIKEPVFLFDGFDNGPLTDIENAYALAILGDSITTDHISPAGRIANDNPAALYLQERGVKAQDFISFGARRGNDEVMARGTFSNPRIRNMLADGKEGGYTRHIPSGKTMTIYDAAMLYQEEGIPLVIVAGKAYGTGSSRDWAAKGTYLQGVRAVIAESYERIHRTNLVCMGILPLQFLKGENRESLHLSGQEHFTIRGITEINTTQAETAVEIRYPDGTIKSVPTIARIDTPLELEYFRAGGLMRKLRTDF